MGAIAVNTQHANGKGRGYAETWTSEQLDGLLSEDWLRKMVAEIRGGKEAMKDRLPYICPHYSEFRNNHRAQADIIPEAFTFMTCVDVDDKALVDKAIKRALELNEDEYSDWMDMVLRIEYSARRKVHIYIRIPKGMTIEEAQQDFCKELGIPYDESCITPERFIYVTGKDEEARKRADERLTAKTYVMVGFNVLNKTELELFRYIKQHRDTKFYWDYDTAYTTSHQPSTIQTKYEAGQFILENIRVLGNEFAGRDFFNNMKKPKEITFIQSPTENAQTRYIDEWIKSQQSAANSQLSTLNSQLPNGETRPSSSAMRTSCNPCCTASAKWMPST